MSPALYDGRQREPARARATRTARLAQGERVLLPLSVKLQLAQLLLVRAQLSMVGIHRLHRRDSQEGFTGFTGGIHSAAAVAGLRSAAVAAAAGIHRRGSHDSQKSTAVG